MLLPGVRLDQPELSAVSLSVRDRRLRVEIEPFDLLKRAPRDALHIAIHSGSRVDDFADLLLPLGPCLLHRLAFFFQVALHLAELLDDGLHAVTKTRTRQILVHRLHLGLLAFAGFPGGRDLDQQVTDGNRQRDEAFRRSDPDAFNLAKGFDGFRERLADDDCGVGLGTR